MTPERASIRQHSTSFALAARLLATQARRRAERLYAWCRHADDQIDNALTKEAAAAVLAELRADLDAIYADRTPSAQEATLLALVIADCGLPRLYLDTLLSGFAMDANETRYQTEDELLIYCHRVAGVVGLMMCHALGVSDDRAGPYAGSLGIAMQLTNIARDVAEDWARGRLYLPLDWLPATPVPRQPLDDATAAPAVLRLLDLADHHYQVGHEGLRHLNRNGRVAVRIAAAVYRGIGQKVRASGCRPSVGRAVVPNWRKGLSVVAAVAREMVAVPPQPIRQPALVWEFDPRTGYTALDTLAPLVVNHELFSKEQS